MDVFLLKNGFTASFNNFQLGREALCGAEEKTCQPRLNKQRKVQVHLFKGLCLFYRTPTLLRYPEEGCCVFTRETPQLI